MSAKQISFKDKLLAPFINYQEAFKASGIYGKIALILEAILLGPGILLFGVVELGLICLIVLYGLIFGLGFILVRYQGGGLKLSTFTFVVVVIVLLALIIALWAFIFRKTNHLAFKKINEEKYTHSIIIKSVVSIFNKTCTWWKDFNYEFKRSDTKGKVSLILSFFIMGIPLMTLKSFVKGLAFLIIQILAMSYMVARGIADLQEFFMLGQASKFQAPIVYGVVALVVLLFFIFIYILNIEQTLIAVKKYNSNILDDPLKRQVYELTNKHFYITSLIVPVLGAVVFTVIPLAFMILIAFTNYSRVQSPGYSSTGELGFLQWVGMDTFKRVFNESANLQDLLSVFAWTIIWALFATATCYFGGLFLAMLLNKKCIKFKVVYRSLFVVAMAMPQFVSLLVMRTMFDKMGPLNTLLTNMGLMNSANQFDYWKNDFSARFLIIFINMWVGIPYYMLLMSGLLINIPKDYYEAATVDGASKRQQFNRITFPNILFMTTPLLITSFVSNINNFNVIWFLTSGGPASDDIAGTAGKTDILITWLYKLTMRRGDYNFGAAIGIIMFIITAVLSLIIFRRSSAYKGEETYR